MRKSAGMPNWFRYVIVVGVIHVLGITLLLMEANAYPQLLGLGFLAYTLGLRHAFDADHIAAIDNTVRKLVQENKDASGIGFYFSLGHSTVVFLMTLATIMAMRWSQEMLPQFQEIGGLVGTAVSGVFLLLIGLFNLYIWMDIYRLFQQARRKQHDEKMLEQLLDSRGFIARLAGPLFRLIRKSWHIYPLGFLFGLGFDTASEVALIAISASAASQTIPLAGILSFPLLFAAGMSLMDTADGLFMIKAYRWAFSTPLRKIYYNLTVTGLSVLAALFIGLVEIAQVLSPKAGLHGPFWSWIQGLEFGTMGYLLVALFIAMWAISYMMWKVLKVEERYG